MAFPEIQNLGRKRRVFLILAALLELALEVLEVGRRRAQLVEAELLDEHFVGLVLHGFDQRRVAQAADGDAEADEAVPGVEDVDVVGVVAGLSF